MMEDFLLCARAVEKNRLGAESGKPLFLVVAENELPFPPTYNQDARCLVKWLRKETTGARVPEVDKSPRHHDLDPRVSTENAGCRWQGWLIPA